MVACKRCWAPLPEAANFCGLCGQRAHVMMIPVVDQDNINTSVISDRDNNASIAVIIPAPSPCSPFEPFPSLRMQDQHPPHTVHQQSNLENDTHQQFGQAQGTYQARLIQARRKQTKAARILRRQGGTRQQVRKVHELSLVQARAKQTKVTNNVYRRILFVSTIVISTTIIALISMTLLVADSRPLVPSLGTPSSELGGNAIPVSMSTSTPLPTPVPTVASISMPVPIPVPTVVPPISTPLPTPVPTVVPPISTPLPTPVPTPVPTVVPTPLPTPVPPVSTPLPTPVSTVVPTVASISTPLPMPVSTPVPLIPTPLPTPVPTVASISTPLPTPVSTPVPLIPTPLPTPVPTVVPPISTPLPTPVSTPVPTAAPILF